MMNDGKPRCTHGYLVVLKVEDEWTVPYPSDKCPRCPRGKPCGVRYRTEPSEALPPPPPKPKLVECPKPGCCLIIEEGTEHSAPCLDPDLVAKTKPTEQEGYAVEVNHSAKWHAPIAGWSPKNRIGNVHTLCGLFGKVTDRTLAEAVDCKKCLKTRSQ